MRKRPRKSLMDILKQKLSVNRGNVQLQREELELFVDLLSPDEFQLIFQNQIKNIEKQIGQMEKGTRSKIRKSVSILIYILSPKRAPWN